MRQPGGALPINDRKRNSIQVIGRAAAILRALERVPEGLSLRNVAETTGLARSTTQRIVTALIEEQLLAPASRKGRIRLGLAFARLAATATLDIAAIAQPVLQDLCRRTRETVDLSVLRDDHAALVDQMVGSQRLVAVSSAGDTFPLHCTANGKALLALLPPDKLNRILAGPLTRFTEHTITDAAALRAVIAEVRAVGFAYDDEEYHLGISAIGTAFFDPLGNSYALSIPAPSARFSNHKTELQALLSEARAELAKSLGGCGATA